MKKSSDVEAAREWLREHQYATHVRFVLERGLEYADAVERAGLCMETVDGDDLYRFLTAASAQEARRATLLESNL